MSVMHVADSLQLGGNVVPARHKVLRDAVFHIHLAHKSPILRAGLAAILSKVSGWRVTSIDDDGAIDPEVGIIVTDYADGLLMATLQTGLASRILIISDLIKEGDVRRAIECGVQGYLLHGATANELIACVRSIGLGSTYLSPGATKSVIDSFARVALTRRENDVLQELATGASDKLIARRLDIGIGTVKSHMKHLMAKLDASARIQVVIVAHQRGLVNYSIGDIDEKSLNHLPHAAAYSVQRQPGLY